MSVLDTDYGRGTSGALANGLWPAALTHDARGDVMTSDGRNLGNLIPSGWNLAYQVESNGSFTIGVSGPVITELAVYNSSVNEYLAWCEASDTSCKTDSPENGTAVPGGSATAAPSTI